MLHFGLVLIVAALAASAALGLDGLLATLSTTHSQVDRARQRHALDRIWGYCGVLVFCCLDDVARCVIALVKGICLGVGFEALHGGANPGLRARGTAPLFRGTFGSGALLLAHITHRRGSLWLRLLRQILGFALLQPLTAVLVDLVRLPFLAWVKALYRTVVVDEHRAALLLGGC